ncbi:MAG: hypothetical protein AABW89_05480 [Nanoarchaeota archaeon]
MVAIENILLMNTGISSVVLLLLLFISFKKNHKPEKREYLTKDLVDLKDEIIG